MNDVMRPRRIHPQVVGAVLGAVVAVVAACSGEVPDVVVGSPTPTPTRTHSPTPTQAPSEILEGTYRARVPARAFRGEFSWLDRGLAGRWTLRFEDQRFVLQSGDIRIAVESYEARDGEFHASGLPAPAGAYNCFDEDGTRITGVEVTGVYEYEMTEDAIEFTEVDEPCPVRRLFLERRWRRV